MGLLGLRTRWRLWPPLTSRAALSRRPLRDFYRRHLRPRGCWCWMRRAARFTAWARRFCGRPSSAPTSFMRRCWNATGTRGRRVSRAGRGRAAVEPAVPDRRAQRRAHGAQAHRTDAAEPNGLWQAGREQVFDGGSARRFSMPSRSAFRPRRCCAPCFRISCWRPRSWWAGRRRLPILPSPRCLYRAHSGPARRLPQPRFSATLIEPAIAEACCASTN